MTSDFDVLISGAGPSGCTAALALGSSGLRVALIEKDKFPRDKVCGDAIPAYVPKVLNTINPDYSNAFASLTEKAEADVCRFVGPDRKAIDLKFSENGFVCRRQIFDNFLFELVSGLSGVTIFQETAVRDISINKNHVLIRAGNNLELTAKLAIGCDGPGSILRKRLTTSKTRAVESSLAARAYFRNVKDNPYGTLEFHFLKELLPGYFWIFPLPGNLYNVGLGMPSAAISEKKINPRNEMLRIIESDPFLSRRFSEAEMTGEIRGHMLPLLTRRSEISGERFMLCGDAASLINPATGAGIGQAMQSGRTAGWQALKCFENNDFSAEFIRSYDKTVYDIIWHENRNYLFIRDHILKYPWRLNTAINLGSKYKTINREIIRLLE